MVKRGPGRPSIYKQKPIKYNVSLPPDLKKQIFDEAEKRGIKPNRLIMDAVKYYFDSINKNSKETEHYIERGARFREGEESIEDAILEVYDIFKNANIIGDEGTYDQILIEMAKHCKNIKDVKGLEAKRIIVQKTIKLMVENRDDLQEFKRFDELLKKLDDFILD